MASAQRSCSGVIAMRVQPSMTCGTKRAGVANDQPILADDHVGWLAIDNQAFHLVPSLITALHPDKGASRYCYRGTLGNIRWRSRRCVEAPINIPCRCASWPERRKPVPAGRAVADTGTPIDSAVIATTVKSLVICTLPRAVVSRSARIVCLFWHAVNEKLRGCTCRCPMHRGNQRP